MSTSVASASSFASAAASLSARVTAVRVRGFTLPTDAPESDGTLEWNKTKLVVVEVDAGGMSGLGFTYADEGTATVVREILAPAILTPSSDALATAKLWASMVLAVRNVGRAGIASMAVSAVDAALWDLKGKLLGAPVATLLGAARTDIELYGSGGFTSYDDARLSAQLGGWVEAGFRHVKMKVGREPGRDAERVRAARKAIGSSADLFVDANGAYRRKQALDFAHRFAVDADVRWFEEPVSSDDLDGLRLLRDRAPAPMDVAAGEYAYDTLYIRRMLAAGAVDVVQADASRCGGITGFMRVAAVAESFQIPLSAHCAPALHLHPAAAAPGLLHVEWFHDHARIEALAFDGAPTPRDGKMAPDLSRPGLGLALKETNLARFSW